MELTFKLSLRVAKVLEPEKNDQKELFDFVSGMYSLRGNVVHGDPPSDRYDLSKETISRLEEILRTSIKLWLVDKPILSRTNLRNVVFK